jgi:hypothetical protein
MIVNYDDKGNPILSKTIAGTMFPGSDNEAAFHTTAATKDFVTPVIGSPNTT